MKIICQFPPFLDKKFYPACACFLQWTVGRKRLTLLLHRTVRRRGILFTIYASMELQPLPVVAPVSLAYDFQYSSISRSLKFVK